MGKIIDIDAEEDTVTRGMRRRRARTGQKEKAPARFLWIVVGVVVAVVGLRVADRYFPRQPQPALPPPVPPPEV